MRVCLFFIEKGAIGGIGVEGLVVGIELHVFDEGMLPVCFLRPE
jgi:hypothetical protein